MKCLHLSPVAKLCSVLSWLVGCQTGCSLLLSCVVCIHTAAGRCTGPDEDDVLRPAARHGHRLAGPPHAGATTPAIPDLPCLRACFVSAAMVQ